MDFEADQNNYNGLKSYLSNGAVWPLTVHKFLIRVYSTIHSCHGSVPLLVPVAVLSDTLINTEGAGLKVTITC